MMIPLDGSRQLRFGPNDLADPEVLTQALDATGRSKKVLFAHETDRFACAELVGDGAGHDVDLVEPSRGDQEISPVYTSPAQDIRTRTAACQKLNVEVGEPISVARVRIDDDDVVV